MHPKLLYIKMWRKCVLYTNNYHNLFSDIVRFEFCCYSFHPEMLTLPLKLIITVTFNNTVISEIFTIYNFYFI